MGSFLRVMEEITSLLPSVIAGPQVNNTISTTPSVLDLPSVSSWSKVMGWLGSLPSELPSELPSKQNQCGADYCHCFLLYVSCSEPHSEAPSETPSENPSEVRSDEASSEPSSEPTPA